MPADQDTVIADLKAEVRSFCEARDWDQFHGRLLYPIELMRGHVAWFTAVIAVVLGAGACSDGSRGGEHPTSDGPTRWTAVEELRIGTAGIAGTETEQFGSIEDIAVDSRGRIYVLDWMSQRVSVFNRDGSFSRAIGGKGEGPGEIAGAHYIHIGSGDTLWVVEDGNARYSRFSADGSYIDSYPRRIRGGGTAEGTVLSDGTLVDWAPHAPDGRFAARFQYIPVRLTVEDTFKVDTLPAIEHIFRMTGDGMIPETRFGGTLTATVDQSGRIWFAHTQEYRVYGRTLGGDTIRTLHLGVSPKPTGEAERDYVRQTFREEFANNYLENLSETRPVVLRIVPDGAGHLFIFADVVGEASGTVVDVFEDSGAYVARLRLPIPVASSPSTPVVHATPGYLYVVVRDDLDVPYVQRLRIVTGDELADAARSTNQEAP